MEISLMNTKKIYPLLFIAILLCGIIGSVYQVVPTAKAYATGTNTSYTFASNMEGFASSTDLKPVMLNGQRYICQNDWTQGASDAINIYHADENWTIGALMTSAGFASGDFYVHTLPNLFPDLIIILGTTFSYNAPRAGYISAYNVTGNSWTYFTTDSEWVTDIVNPSSDIIYISKYLHADGSASNWIWKVTAATLFSSAQYQVGADTAIRLNLPAWGIADMEPRITVFQNNLYVLQYNHKWAFNVSSYDGASWSYKNGNPDATDSLTVPMLFPFIQANVYAVTWAGPDRANGVFHIYYSTDGTTITQPLDVPVFTTTYERHCIPYPYGSDKLIVMDIGSNNQAGFIGIYTNTGALIAKGTGFLSHYLESNGIFDGNKIVMGGETNNVFKNADIKIITVTNTVYTVGGGWVANEPFRQSHVINQTVGAQPNYQINMTVYSGAGTSSGSTAYLNNKGKSDFGDLRFTNADGLTPLPYWIETYTAGVSATVWVNVHDQLATGNVTIYMYYGNWSFTTTSSASTTFLDLITGTIQALPMDENTGTTTADRSGNSLTGTMQGANIGWTTGKFGSAIKTTTGAAGSYMSFGTTTTLNVNDLTISFWFKPNNLFNGDTWRAMWSKYANDTNRAQIFLDKTDMIMYGSILTAGVQRITLTNANNYWSPTWIHVVMTMGITNSSLYVNGDLISSDTTNHYSMNSIKPSSEYLFTDAVGGAYGDNFNGTIDEFFAFNSALGLGDAVMLANYYPWTSTYNAGTTYIRQRTATEPVQGTWGAEENPYVIITIASTGEGTTNPVPGYYNVTIGTVQTITAIPNDHYQFSYWSYVGSNNIGIFSTDNPVLLTPSETATITAHYSYNGTLPTASPSPTPVTTGIPTTPTPTPNNYVVGSTNQTFYFRSDIITSENTTASYLGTENTNNNTNIFTSYSGDITVKIGFRVYIHTLYTDQELTGGTPNGIISVGSGVGDAYVNGYWTPQSTAVLIGNNTFKVVTYLSGNNGVTWTSIATHVSKPIVTTGILSQTWQFTMNVSRFAFGGATYFYVNYGNTATSNSRISGIGTIIPSSNELQSYRMFSGDFIGFLVHSYDIAGVGLYPLLMLIPIGTLYLRHAKTSVILMFAVLFGGMGVGFNVLLPSFAALPTYAILVLILSFMIYKVWKR
jgi:hypothetical protein